jgi:hypothetical protein
VTRVFAPPQTAEQKARVKYLCCACGHHGRRKHTCGFCGSEDVFDKTLPEWSCLRCKENTALYESVCVECQKELFAGALAEALGLIDRDDETLLESREDYGSTSHRVFLGSFLSKESL